MTIGDAVDGVGSITSRYRADQVTGVSSGSGVATWPDAGPSAFNATQATGANQLTYQSGVVNGQPVLRCTAGTSHYMTSGASTSDSLQTIVCVASPSALPSSSGATFRGGSAAGALDWRLTATSPQGRMELLKEDVASLGTSTTVASTGAFQVFMVTYNSSTGAYAFFRNGTAEGSGTNAQALTAGLTLRIGDHFNTSQEPWVGDIAELINFSKVLTTAERTTVDSYCQDRYGITVSDYVSSGTSYTQAPADSAYTGDLLPVLPPDGLTATVASTTEIDLTWFRLAGAVSYDLERNGVVIATGLTGLSYSDTGLTPGTTYTYNIRSVY